MPTPTLDPVKRGDTFRIVATYKEGGVPTSVADMDIRAQLRASDGTLISELVVAKANQTTSPGVFTLTHDGATSAWAVDTLDCDIEFSSGGVVRSTQTFKVPVERDVTRDA